ncbi:MAG: gamma-glutamyl-gamma-aminobutyrate hydrolase family protein [Gammaproteobacteria bacterium]|nr:gamma-glutamyl-gamma-aminobutyrate hydrolase family protein [Gammaproteobacteria bacterium]
MNEEGLTELRDEHSELGGTMRLGAQSVRLLRDSLVHGIYGKEVIRERHRHRYEFNNRYGEALEAAGMQISADGCRTSLVEVVELPAHPWYLGCQFHPEFTSTPRDGHPAVHRLHPAPRQAARRATPR